ncbi:beta-galactoside alpha-2,6-sialyltransferase 2-like isoform X2 [Artemia franciscana]
MTLITQLRISMYESALSLNSYPNIYGAKYSGIIDRGAYTKPSDHLLCKFKKSVKVKTVLPKFEPFKVNGFGKLLKSENILQKQHFNSCAIVSSSGALLGSNMGQEIDSHDFVVRFNNAPTESYEQDVGTKTSLRIVNSQVVAHPVYEFLVSSMFENVSLLVWDPSNYTAALETWYNNPDIDFFNDFFEKRRTCPYQDMHLLHPRTLWRLWDFIQGHSPVNIHPNPPSSGFLGLLLMLEHCNIVKMYEYVPSTRVTSRCHYYDNIEEIGCTTGEWHPLAAEKLLALAMSIASDEEVFEKGFLKIKGFNKLDCKS